MHGIGYWPTGYHLRLVCLPKGRKATKKCVEQDRKAVLVPYSKAAFWKISEAICIRTDPEYRDLALLGNTVVHFQMKLPKLLTSYLVQD